ncbi:MAG TPA: hypothetical protein ENL39_01000 [Candidatus Aerophobetes bacterium]|uniref:Uncharacterized protein n=1 Tax=Aerophobetes bacterium TaxID=2030807 RepID=A0A7V5LYE0_UNCAE|nr:hypothetical protein [Candidatus Aerophobetes bacterium]
MLQSHSIEKEIINLLEEVKANIEFAIKRGKKKGAWSVNCLEAQSKLLKQIDFALHKVNEGQIEVARQIVTEIKRQI